MQYSNQTAAFAAQAELNGQEMLGGTLFVMVMQSMPMQMQSAPVQMQAPHMPNPYHISMSPPGYAMAPGPMMLQTQFPLEW